MLDIKTKDFKQVVEYSIENNSVVLVSGAPGVGKSQILHSVCEQLGRDLIDIRLYNKAEFSAGLPTVQETYIEGKKHYTTFFTLPDWLLHLKNLEGMGKNPVVLFDDLHLLEESFQKPLYEFFEKYELNGHQVKPCPIFILGNFNLDNLNHFVLQSPIMNRLEGAYHFTPDLASFLSLSTIHSKVKFFLSIHRNEPSFFYTEDPMDGNMFPSPRAWENFSRQVESHPMRASIAKAILGEEVGSVVEVEWDTLCGSSNPYDYLKTGNNDFQTIGNLSMIASLLDTSNLIDILSKVEVVFKSYPEALSWFMIILSQRDDIFKFLLINISTPVVSRMANRLQEDLN